MEVKITRSRQRRKTVTARLVNNELHIFLPAGMTSSEEQSWIEKMTQRVKKAQLRRELNGRAELHERAEVLNQRYFQGMAPFSSIEYVTNQQSMWGSCSTHAATIRISHRLATMPLWVLDYVIVHELAHLLEANHSRAFWKHVHRYPLAERAIGYLIGCGMQPDNIPAPGKKEA